MMSMFYIPKDMNLEIINKQPYKSSRLKTILKSHEYADCYFIIDGEKIPAHRLLLACSSPVFEKMFYGALPTTEVEVTDVDASNFRQMLEFVYTDNVILESVQDAWNLYYIANKYLLEDLISFCVTYIEKNLTMDTLALSYELSELYGETRLQNSCWYDMTFYTKGVSLYESEYHIKCSTLYRLLKESSALSNYDKLIFIIKWAVNECNATGRNVSDQEVIDVISNLDLLKYVDKIHLDSLPEEHLKVDLTSLEDIVLRLCIKEIEKTHFDCYEEMNLEIKPDTLNIRATLHCRIRQLYKIAGAYNVSDNEPLCSGLETNRKVVLFGVVINTEHEPPFAGSSMYEGINTISITGKNTGKKVHAYFQARMPYDSTQYIPFNHLATLDPDQPYNISVTYTNLMLGTSSVVLHYLNYNVGYDKYEKSKPVFKFSDFFGSVIRAVCFYPL